MSGAEAEAAEPGKDAGSAAEDAKPARTSEAASSSAAHSGMRVRVEREGMRAPRAVQWAVLVALCALAWNVVPLMRQPELIPELVASYFHTSVPPEGTPAEDLGDFYEWLRGRNATWEGVAVHDLRDASMGRGLVATRPLKREELVLEVPLGAHLLCEPPLLEHVPRDFPDRLRLCLAARLAEARRRPADPFAPYARALPDPPELPWEWADDELAALQDDEAAGRCRRWREQARAFVETGGPAEALRAALPERFPPGSLSGEELRWALSTVLSRALNDRLVPLFDFGNHRETGAEATGQVEEESVGSELLSVRVHAPRAVPAGQQLFLSYGRSLSGLNIFETFGYVPPLEEHRVVRSVRFAPSDRATALLLAAAVATKSRDGSACAPAPGRAAGGAGGERGGRQVVTVVAAHGKIPSRLVEAGRLVVWAAGGNKHLPPRKANNVQVIGRENEMRALLWSARTVRGWLKEHPTTVEEDRAEEARLAAERGGGAGGRGGGRGRRGCGATRRRRSCASRRSSRATPATWPPRPDNDVSRTTLGASGRQPCQDREL
eukprot:tig00001086_g6853.t1